MLTSTTDWVPHDRHLPPIACGLGFAHLVLDGKEELREPAFLAQEELINELLDERRKVDGHVLATQNGLLSGRQFLVEVRCHIEFVPEVHDEIWKSHNRRYMTGAAVACLSPHQGY